MMPKASGLRVMMLIEIASEGQTPRIENVVPDHPIKTSEVLETSEVRYDGNYCLLFESHHHCHPPA